MHALLALLLGVATFNLNHAGALAQNVEVDPHVANLAARALKTLTTTRRITTAVGRTVTKTITSTKTYDYYPTEYVTSTRYVATKKDHNPTTVSELSFVSTLPASGGKLAARAEKTTTVRKTVTVTKTKTTGKPKTRTSTVQVDYYPMPTVTTVIKATKTVPAAGSIRTAVVDVLREPYVRCGAYSDLTTQPYSLRQTGKYELICDHFNYGTGEDTVCRYSTTTGQLNVEISDSACTGPATTRDIGEGGGCIDIAACEAVPSAFPGYVFDRANSYKEFVIPDDGDGSRSLFCRYVNPTSDGTHTCIYDSETGLGDPFNTSEETSIFGQGPSSDDGCPAQLGTNPVRSYCIDAGGLYPA